MDKTCVWCGKTIHNTKWDQKYCRQRCKNDLRFSKREERRKNIIKDIDYLKNENKKLKEIFKNLK